MEMQPDLASHSLAPEAAHDDRRPPIKGVEGDVEGVHSEMQPLTAKPAHHLEEVKPKNSFDKFVAVVRKRTPDGFVNRGSQFNFGLKATADIMSVWSSVRKGSASPARLTASLITLFTEVLGVFYKEKGIPEDQEQKYKKMNAGEYLLQKTKEGFNPKDHILETVGLATIGNGIFTTISGLNQSVKTRVSWEIFQGIMTTAAGLIMSYWPNRERAWQISTAIFWTRAPVAGKQAYNAYYHGVPEKGIAKGDWQQAAKWVLNQTSNLFGVFFGGVRKLPDGTIVRIGKDEDELTPEQLMELRETSLRHPNKMHNTRDESPDTTVSSISRREIAVPQKREAVMTQEMATPHTAM